MEADEGRIEVTPLFRRAEVRHLEAALLEAMWDVRRTIFLDCLPPPAS
ncbi:hypothetical protein [Pyrobaculum sp.]